ncbi:MAG: hypothetical protein AAFV53_02075 [Myxococcota bacterium]
MMMALFGMMLASMTASAGAYGAPTASVALNESGMTLLRGGRGGVIIDGRWTLGGEGVSSRRAFGEGEGISYGAFFFERTFLTDGTVHPAVEFSLGGGDISQNGVRAAAMVSTVGAHLDIDVSDWLRLSLGGGYLLTLPDERLSGSWRVGRPTLDFMVKFGGF